MTRPDETRRSGARGSAVSAGRGFALPVALIAIMVIGAVVTGGFWVSSRQARAERDQVLGEQAFYVADLGLEDALGSWRNGTLARIDSAVVEPEREVTQDDHPLGSYEVDIRRIGPALYLFSSTGRVRAGGRTVVRRASSVVRVLEPGLPASAALAVYGGLTVGERTRIEGGLDDAREDCGERGAGVAAFDVSLVASSGQARITGTPPVEGDSTLDTVGLSRFGDVPLADLVATATKVYEDGESEAGMGPATTRDAAGAEICDASVRGNWGDPSGQGVCAGEFPIILGMGDLRLETGSGQGILIVEGDLTLGGDVEFYGLVIVKGELRTVGADNRVDGGVVVHGDGRLDSRSAALGGSVIRYSRCRVDRAFDAVLRPRPISTRSRTAFAPSGRAVAAEDS